jgi:hypothetical protein
MGLGLGVGFRWIWIVGFFFRVWIVGFSLDSDFLVFSRVWIWIGFCWIRIF